MHRKFRQYFTQISIVLVMITGVWLGVPRDVCLTKTFTGLCACPSETTKANSCQCCDASKTPVKTSCCDKESDSSRNGDEGAACLSVSSMHFKVNSPERVYIADFSVNTFAVLPLYESTVNISGIAEMEPQADVACIDRKDTSRENCVYLI